MKNKNKLLLLVGLFIAMRYLIRIYMFLLVHVSRTTLDDDGQCRMKILGHDPKQT